MGTPTYHPGTGWFTAQVRRQVGPRLVPAMRIAASSIFGASAANRSIASGHAATAGVKPDAAGIVWLCRPSRASDPCMFPLNVTVVQASGAKTVKNLKPAADCLPRPFTGFVAANHCASEPD